jgi:ribosomal-protein-alanine N-acetyltransferase
LGFLPRAETQVAEQGAGSGAFYVLVDEDGSVLGRFNLYDLENSAWR